MSLSDDISALPGGPAVVSALDTVNAVDTGALLSLASRWRRAADQCHATAAAVTRVVGRLDGQWTGATATSFTDYTSTLVSAGSTLSGALTQAANAVDQAASAISGVQSWAGTRCEWLLTEARNWSTASSAQQANAISALCSQTAAELGQLAGSISADLAMLSSAITQLSGQEKPYDAINPPAGMTMTVSYTVPTYRLTARTPARPVQQAQSGVVGGAVGAGGAAAVPASPGLVAGKLTQGAPLSPRQSESYAPMVTQSTAAPAVHTAAVVTQSSGRPAPSGQVNDWIEQALAILRANGVDTSQISPADLYTIIQHESSGNPDAVNNWDYNAAAGHPSMGLMQTIDTTFNAYKLPGHDNILNPVDNIIAGVRYALARYGSISAVPGVQAVNGGGSYVGY